LQLYAWLVNSSWLRGWLVCRAVAAFRVWLHEKAGGDVGWAKGATSADLPPKLSRDQLLSRWDRHTKDCASCKQVTPSISPDMSQD